MRSVSVADAKISDLAKANNYIRKLKSEKVSLQFPNLGNIEQCSILCFSDAAFANLRNVSSQGGFIIFLINNNNRYAPISWKSRKIQCVVKSTLAAETLALEEYYMIRLILLEIYNIKSNSELFPIRCYTDNKSLLDSVYSTKTLKKKD